MRLTGRGRVVFGSLLCLALSLAAYSVFSVLPGSGAAAGPGASSGHSSGPSSSLSAAVGTRVTTVVVQPGQTLWQIGHALSPDSDTREVVARLERLNHLSDGALVAGQTLQLP